MGCNDDAPCGPDPVHGPMTCSEPFLATNDGVQWGLCSTGCTNFPDDCGGSGSGDRADSAAPGAYPARSSVMIGKRHSSRRA